MSIGLMCLRAQMELTGGPEDDQVILAAVLLERHDGPLQMQLMYGEGLSFSGGNTSYEYGFLLIRVLVPCCTAPL